MIPQSFGERLTGMRLIIGIGLRRCAREAGVSASYLCDVEQGRRLPSFRLAQALARVLSRPELVEMAQEARLTRWRSEE